MIGTIRLGSGLFLTLFVTLHFINHALGVISPNTQESGAQYFTHPWGQPPLVWFLMTALVAHVATSLIGLYRRRHLRMPTWQKYQFFTGLLMPFFLAPHLIPALIYIGGYAIAINYHSVLAFLWGGSPERNVVQILLLFLVWMHSVIGVWSWLRLKSGFGRWRLTLGSLAILLPSLAFSGYVAAGMRVRLLAENPEWRRQLAQQIGFVDVADEVAKQAIMTAWLSLLALVAALFVARWLRTTLSHGGKGRLNLHYDGKRRLKFAPGTTALETIHLAGIPHPSLCGGRGRCTTCRVRVVEGEGEIPERNPTESAALSRIAAPAGVRLACQIQPVADLALYPLLEPTVCSEAVTDNHGKGHGEERDVVVLFADLRGFTQLSQDRFPYDVVFILNRYFQVTGEAIEKNGGYLDKFIGDGIMALFGLEGEVGQATRASLKAARAMGEALEKLNNSLASELSSPLRIGVGIHTGRAIIGEMGYGTAKQLTAIGDVVNTASRLEGLTKENGVQLIVSQRTLKLSGLSLPESPVRALAIRGRDRPLTAHLVNALTDLP
ncbi:MAG: 2Fe-2S iron-sulfur cluster binding domain-containing protein [Magnetococcales bacterium]|nr:2Fe-2S iron-sulfur cluster binding domain-containing protein [Magnetococcales bacterium]